MTRAYALTLFLALAVPLQALAADRGVSAEALQIAKDLTGKGYLLEAGSDCDTPQNACADCPVTSSCHIPMRYWSLTEKGRRAIRAEVSTGQQ